MKLRTVLKYLSYFMGFLIVLLISVFLIFKAWLDNRLESGSLDISFVNSHVQNYLNESYSGLKFNFEKISLVKAENQDIAILLKGLQVNSNQNGVTLTAVNTELKNGLMSSILGPITEFPTCSKTSILSFVKIDFSDHKS